MMPAGERDHSTVQSLTRGLTVLRLLAQHGEATATEIAEKLGLHQSSVSRMLRSLEQAGFVCKPSFHSFALDYGVLLFAGVTMESFPEVAMSVRACARLNAQTGWGAAVAILREDRLIYLARLHGGPANTSAFVSASDFPIHCSSLGLILLYHRHGKRMIPILAESIARHDTENVSVTPEALYESVHNKVLRHGVLALERDRANAFNIAGLFHTRRGPAALALFGTDAKAKAGDVIRLLRKELAVLDEPSNAAATAKRKELQK